MDKASYVSSRKQEQEASCREPVRACMLRLCEDDVTEIVRRVFGFTVTHMKRLHGYNDVNYHILVDSEHSNPFVDGVSSHGYVFKILNEKQSAQPQIVDAQRALMEHVRACGLRTQQTVPNLLGTLLSPERFLCKGDQGRQTTHLVILRSYLPGRTLQSVVYTPRLLRNTGILVGSLAEAMKTFSHPFFESYDTEWNLRNTLQLRQYLSVLESPADRVLVESVLEHFENQVLSREAQLPTGIIHGDINPENIIVQENPSKGLETAGEDFDIHGVIDFGDASFSHPLFDLAINIAHLCTGSTLVDELEVGGHVLGGFLERCRMGAAEYGCLRACVMARLAQCLVLGAHSYLQDPSNDSVLDIGLRGWPVLRRLWATPASTLYAIWDAISGGVSGEETRQYRVSP